MKPISSKTLLPVTAPIESTESEICSVCFDEVVENSLRLRCGHEFHASCFAGWENETKPLPTCPNCRKSSLPPADRWEGFIKKYEQVIEQRRRERESQEIPSFLRQLLLAAGGADMLESSGLLLAPIRVPGDERRPLVVLYRFEQVPFFYAAAAQPAAAGSADFEPNDDEDQENRPPM